VERTIRAGGRRQSTSMRQCVGQVRPDSNRGPAAGGLAITVPATGGLQAAEGKRGRSSWGFPTILRGWRWARRGPKDHSPSRRKPLESRPDAPRPARRWCPFPAGRDRSIGLYVTDHRLSTVRAGWPRRIAWPVTVGQTPCDRERLRLAGVGNRGVGHAAASHKSCPGASKIVTSGLRPRWRSTAIKLAPSRALRPRRVTRGDRPSERVLDGVNRTVRCLRRPAKCQSTTPTTKARPGNRAAASSHRHGIGPRRNSSPGLCRGSLGRGG